MKVRREARMFGDKWNGSELIVSPKGVHVAGWWADSRHGSVPGGLVTWAELDAMRSRVCEVAPMVECATCNGHGLHLGGMGEPMTCETCGGVGAVPSRKRGGRTHD